MVSSPPQSFLHSIDAIEHEVHENLLQLAHGLPRLGKILSKLGADGDRVAVRLAAQKDNHFSNELIYINQLPLQSSFLNSKLILPMMSVARVTSLTSLDAASRGLRQVGVIATKHRKQVLAFVTAAEIAADLVRQRCRQLAHGGHAT